MSRVGTVKLEFHTNDGTYPQIGQVSFSIPDDGRAERLEAEVVKLRDQNRALATSNVHLWNQIDDLMRAQQILRGEQHLTPRKRWWRR